MSLGLIVFKQRKALFRIATTKIYNITMFLERVHHKANLRQQQQG